MDHDLWVFGYGSLMWNPGFRFADRAIAELEGHRRSFCLASVRYRGTPENPGLVLALEPLSDARCRGIAYRIAETDREEVVAYLRERELGTYSYHETILPLTLHSCGRRVEAMGFVIDQTHDQYRCGLSLDAQAQIIATSIGPAGTNSEYLFNTLDHLREIGVDDAELEELALKVRKLLPG